MPITQLSIVNSQLSIKKIYLTDTLISLFGLILS